MLIKNMLILSKAMRISKYKIVRQFSTPNSIEVFINGEKHLVDPRMTIFQACHSVGVVIPRFCYHEKLSIAGNCRMCLVEVEKAPKPVASCTAQVAPGMKIYTESEKTRIARGGVMEFLLMNHPLDCPICDQGGECDLQDIYMGYGFETSRYNEYKRAVEDKNIGPIITTNMNRCIHCTRCVRFAEEVIGENELGTMGRGKATEIGTYVEKMMTSELSGNLADLCPVGALSHGPYAFTSRPHELKSVNSIDIMESIIPSVEYNYRGPEIMRCLPKIHEVVNDEWISDKSRYAYDGLKRQRLTTPLIKNKTSSQFEEITWEEAIKIASFKISSLKNPKEELLGLIGEFNNVEEIVATKDLFGKLNNNNFAINNYPIKGSQRCEYLFNRSIPEIEELDVLLLVGANPKFESPLLNVRILQGVKSNKLKVFKIGSPDDLNYKFYHLGNSTGVIEDIISGKSSFTERLKKAKNAHVVFSSLLSNNIEETNELYFKFKNFVDKDCNNLPDSKVTIGVLNNFVGHINGYEAGLNYKSIDEVNTPTVIYNMGNDNQSLLNNLYNKTHNSFTIYQGHNGDIGASYADLILPTAPWTESNGTYCSLEGRIQTSKKVVSPSGQAKESWKIIRALSEEMGLSLNYDTPEEISYRIAEIAPHLLKSDFIEPYKNMPSKQNISNKKIEDRIIGSVIDNYYKTDAISRSSAVMAKCSAAYNHQKLSNFLKKSLE